MFDIFSKLKRNEVVSGPPEYIIVGLGNPGKEYEHTRHNVGFLAIDEITDKIGTKPDRIKYKSLTCEGTISGKKCLFMKPSTFMNLSGQAVCEAMSFYKISPENVIVIFDDISLPIGKMRIRTKGSDGGHNGIKNIIYLSGSDKFMRIKIGVGERPNPNYDLADWVLSKFTKPEFETISEMFGKSKRAVELIVNEETNKAMNEFN